MHEISPVLTNAFDSPDYAPAQVNINGGMTSREGPKAASDAGSTDSFSFSDVLDLINPLQHIPLISSIYREVTNENINPVSRVAGDILYGGVFGLATAAISGAGAAADSVMEAETGKDTVGNIVAGLFEDKDTPEHAPEDQTEIAATTPSPSSSEVIAETTEALPSKKPPATQNPSTNEEKEEEEPATPSATIPLATPSSGKQPFGGIMRQLTPTSQPGIDLALSSGPRTTRIGNRIYTNPSIVGNRSSAPVATASVSTATPTSSTTADQQKLKDDIQIQTQAQLQSLGLINASTLNAKDFAEQIGNIKSTSNPAISGATALMNNGKINSLPLLPLPQKSTTALNASRNTPVSSSTADSAPISLLPLLGQGATHNDVTSSTYIPSTGVTNDLPQALIDNMSYMKALNQYRNVAGSSSNVTGANLNMTN